MKVTVIDPETVQAALSDPALSKLDGGPAQTLLASLAHRDYGETVALIVVRAKDAEG